MANIPNSLKGFRDCPVLGVGLGLRRGLWKDTQTATHLIDWLEFTPENYMGRGGKTKKILTDAQTLYPLVSHGVHLSVGSCDPFDATYLKDLAELFDWVNPPWFSDHLSFSSIDGRYFNDLIPLPRTPETVRHVADRIAWLQDHFQRPFVLENVSFYLEYPESTLSEADFLAQIVEAADCGLLLDVNNVYVNSQNHGWEAEAFIDSLPLNRVVYLHMAGHHQGKHCIIDTHGSAIKPDVWHLLEVTLQKLSTHTPCGVLLERDSHLPPFAEISEELVQLRALWEQYFPASVIRHHLLETAL